MFFVVLELGDLGAFLIEKNLVSRPAMQPSYPQRPAFGSGQASSNALFRSAMAGTGMNSMRQPSRFSQPNDNHNNPNNTYQQQPTHMSNSRFQAGIRQQSSNTL